MKPFFCTLLCCIASLAAAITVPFSNDILKTPANRISGMERIFPADKLPLDLATDCYLWHDGKNLYLYWEMEINEDFAPGVFATRDDIQDSDYVRLQLKTIPNEDFAYYFSAFPRGNAYDAIRNENLQVDRAWNSLYECTSSYSEKNWTVKMTIPFRDLRFGGNPPYQWSFTLARQVKGTNSSYAYPFSPVANRTPRQYFDSFEPLVIHEKIENPKNYYVIPYFYKSYDFLTEEDSFDPKHLGLNLVYRPSSSSSIKMAFNPDFTEVPVDEERDSHNDKYPPQLGENRLFFTEDLNAFGVTSSQFYSRNIMQPSYALKFTSSGRNWNLGVLSAKDKETRSDGTVINPADDYNILAFKPQWGNINSQFTLLSRTNFDSDYYNYLLYAAPSYQVSPNWILKSRFAYSADKQGDQDYTTGYMAAVSTDQTLFSNLMTSLSGRVISDKYAPGMGTDQARSDINHYAGNFSFSYEKYLENSLIRTINTNINSTGTWEREGNHEIRSLGSYGNISLAFTPQFTFTLFGNMGSERMPANNKLIDWNEFSANFAVNRWSLISGNISFTNSNYMLYSMIDPQHTYPRNVISAGINGFVGSMISYIFRNDHVIWTELPEASEYYSGVRGDDEYDITNLDMELTFSNDVKLVTGVRYNNYEMYDYSQHVGYFATLHYAIDAYTKLYAGFKSTEDEYLNTMQKTSETAWFKISRTF